MESDESDDRWMALDVGHKRIGVAVSDPLKILARPLCCLLRRNPDADVRAILDLIRDNRVSCLVLGRPLHLDGRAGSSVEPARDLFQRLSKCSSIDIKWCDERLSSKEAEERMAQMKIPIQDRRQRRDAFAAAIILERFIEEGPPR